MNLNEAEALINNYQDLQGTSCTCFYCEPCSKCIECPPEEDYNEAMLFIEESKKIAMIASITVP